MSSQGDNHNMGTDEDFLIDSNSEGQINYNEIYRDGDEEINNLS